MVTPDRAQTSADGDVVTPDPSTAETVPAWIDALTARYGDRLCIGPESEGMTYRELDHRSAELAAGLLARGVGKGTPVGLLFGNGPAWVTWWAALTRLGAVCVPLSTFFQPAELERVIRHTDLHGLVGQSRFLGREFDRVLVDAFPTLAEASGHDLALEAAPYLRWIVLDDAPRTPWSRDDRWIVDAGKDGPWAQLLSAAQRELHPEDDAIVICTSGQSADPKAVVHTHRSVMVKTHYLREMYGFDSDTLTPITLPFFWVGGLTMGLLPTFDAGGTVTCTERSTWGTGNVIGSTADQENLFPAFRLFPALGMTETFGIYSWGREFRVAGHPIASPLDEVQPDTELRVVDESGADVADGEVGEILLRGPTIARALLKRDRSEDFDPDGFYRTGDRGLRDGARVHFVGRLTDMIKTSGANVSPAEVERELNTVDGVAAAFVVPIDDPARQQVVAAAVVLEEGARLSAAEIRDVLRRRLSVYKVPRRILLLSSMEQVPMTPSMKVRKRELATMIASAAEDEPVG
jgi:acyl-CoA synthetase (AMP-forming)/AMP-acid ligase II